MFFAKQNAQCPISNIHTYKHTYTHTYTHSLIITANVETIEFLLYVNTLHANALWENLVNSYHSKNHIKIQIWCFGNTVLKAESDTVLL
jgi:hypothetical protein